MRSRTHHANGSQHSHGAPQSGTGSTEPGHAAPIAGADNVAVAGTTGDDRIVAGANDTMTGGGGTDEFILGITSGKSEITDFAVAGGISLNNAAFWMEDNRPHSLASAGLS